MAFNWLEQPNVLLFGGANRGHLNYLDNFYMREFLVNNRSYPSVEHYFQSAKFLDVDAGYAETIRLAKTPIEAKKLGAAKRLDRSTLDKWKQGGSISAMDTALTAKFSSGSELARRLLDDTGDKTLVELVTDDPTWDDSVWGCGKDGLSHVSSFDKSVVYKWQRSRREQNGHSIKDSPGPSQSKPVNAWPLLCYMIYALGLGYFAFDPATENIHASVMCPYHDDRRLIAEHELLKGPSTKF